MFKRCIGKYVFRTVYIYVYNSIIEKKKTYHCKFDITGTSSFAVSEKEKKR